MLQRNCGFCIGYIAMQDKVALERPLRCASNITQAAFSNNTFVCACKRIQDSIVELVHPTSSKESARQVAKGHAAGPPRAPGHVSVQPIVPNVAFWNQKKISRKAPGRSPKDTLLGRQGRRDTFRCSLVPNVAFWNQKKISRKAPGRWPKTRCWAAKGAGTRFGAT